ncbi:MAG: circularly permuted type 2 ATP-grasp protein, partial [Nitrospirae bacterium]
MTLQQTTSTLKEEFRTYRPAEHTFDEMFEGPEKPRPHYQQLVQRLEELSVRELELKQRQADQAFLRQGIT